MAVNKYYRHLPKWPSFRWTAAEQQRLPQWFKDSCAKIDGTIPSTRLSSWKAFYDFANDPMFARGEYIFRGQQGYKWDLVPSLARGSAAGIFTPRDAKSCLDSFRRSSRGRKDFDPNLVDDLEMWALGQHHGLRTPLIDWSLSPFVALFFAFEKDDESAPAGNSSRVVFALNKTRIEERGRELNLEGWDSHQLIQIFQPSGDSNRRLISQAGLFLSVPPNESVSSWIMTNLGSDEPEELANTIMKVHIPNDGRQECLNMLHRMNIHHASLFPDLIGSSAYTNFELSLYGKDPSITPGTPARGSRS